MAKVIYELKENGKDIKQVSRKQIIDKLAVFYSNVEVAAGFGIQIANYDKAEKKLKAMLRDKRCKSFHFCSNEGFSISIKREVE